MKRIWGNKLILAFVRRRSRLGLSHGKRRQVMCLLVGGILVIIWLRFFPPWGENVVSTTALSTLNPTTTTAPALGGNKTGP